ncbi:ATP synthase subunit C lysine N-methyltransferase isoform X1 [Lepisosteus oculatus]|uniref:Si:dkey-190g11.3 n=1 Tax=Lepisosteus oculatus TaxID=7918 RepID=W5MLI9_LEPOC|nr:PREDICTED: protein FAM173B-like isoform X1 [Lepisosteus oculatus]XP_015221634.1 PREDICTED: protein FAM173B-like isoform X1 [Lepisosteus oculatus]XP_015221640.1 PREDICTED: protein FAM173B-like isoform X1 [Lepisosteus oculatus]XP_015221648.1 PREDICTED: protein FAM173B-like isoform X1 [Lepisosteus oculatus]XP_015221654.1 PREDICTED: protein FAM173B-like isoform X1 [Lepisosteus oculatus]XP_015221660.1 PREDICTED: protein FAM173B-like isoform X1 [Lepisosteus oculatus]
MEDSIDVILQDQNTKFLHRPQDSHHLSMVLGGLLVGFYRLWTMFVQPGFRKVPIKLQVPYLPSSTIQTQNVMKLLEGRKGCLADLGSGDGRLVFAASSLGLQSTGFEINSILLTYARSKAWWKGIPTYKATFVNKDFWKTDLSRYNNVTVFLAPGVMEVLEKKLLAELPDGARVISCRFPFPHWPSVGTEGAGLDQVWAYDINAVRRIAT